MKSNFIIAGALMAYAERTLAQYLSKVDASFPVLLVTGPRQVGKTTLLQHAKASDRRYLTLDDPALRLLAKEDPALFLERFQAPLLIDEIQYAPELLPLIKMAVDAERRPGMYWLTGSQQFHLMKNVFESLAGRVGILKLQGLSQAEIQGRAHTRPFLPEKECIEDRSKLVKTFTLTQVYHRIWQGSFPGLVLYPEMDHALFYASYVQTYLQRDVRDLTRVGDEHAFLKFLKTIAARTGQLVNYANIARDVDISPATAKAWLSILEASGLIYLLEPYHNNLTKRLVKAAKLYFLDTGLCAYLTGWTSPETLEAGAMSGAIFETYVISELLKTYWHAGLEAPFYFYRDKDQQEVDLLILQDGKIYPIEIKKSSKPTRDASKYFTSLEKLKLPIAAGGVICLADQVFPLTSMVDALPVWYL